MSELRDALEQVEWIPSAWDPNAKFHDRRCGWCGGIEEKQGHAPDCLRQKALAAPSEMQQLSQWIEDTFNPELDRESDWREGWRLGAAEILDHIRTKFLGEGK